jgi:hypothetical protein
MNIINKGILINNGRLKSTAIASYTRTGKQLFAEYGVAAGTDAIGRWGITSCHE